MARGQRRERKNVPAGIAHIQSTFNNTIVTITDPQGNVLAWASAGTAGFKGSRKGTPFAAGLAAESAARKAMENGVRQVEVYVKGPGALDVHLHLADAVLHGLARRALGGQPGREGRPLAGPLEPRRPGARPGQDVTLGVRNGHDRVVERRLDVGDSRGHVLALSSLPSRHPLPPSHDGDGAAFDRRPVPTVLRGPFRVRALVRVRWPRTGRPRRWRRPR